MKKATKLLLYIGIPLILVLVIAGVVYSSNTADKTDYSTVIQMIERDEVKEAELNFYDGTLTYVTREDGKKHTIDVVGDVFFADVKDMIREKNTDKNEDGSYNTANDIVVNYEAGGEGSWLMSMLPTIIMIAITIGLFVVIMRRMGGGVGGDKTMSFGKARIKKAEDDKRKTTFADVAGADEEKEEMTELVQFLKDPKKFNELGARIPKGVLLVGPPGTGKTLLARAVAGEAGVPFFSISGSDFVEMFVGVGASRVRDLFDQAKKNSPAIIFIDEIDAVGRQRGAGLGGGHDEREQTLNQLLVEMDGFGANEGVIIIAATNRPDILDRALLRPGRFDRQIMVNYPDVKGREEILKVHARGKPLGPDVNLKTIAQSTAGFTGADLENLLNEAALLAARANRKAIIEADIEEATIKVMMGAEKKSRVIKEKDKMITSYHEAGHAIVSYFLPTQDPVHQISIIPRGMAAGFTMYLPDQDNGHITKTKMEEDICSLLGGRAAEELTQDDICTGASNDIERATELAHNMVTKFGMSAKVGLVKLGTGNNEVFLGRDFSSTPNYSDQMAAVIDNEVRDIIMNQYDKAKDILNKNMKKVHKVAQQLFVNEKISGDDFREIMNEVELDF